MYVSARHLNSGHDLCVVNTSSNYIIASTPGAANFRSSTMVLVMVCINNGVYQIIGHYNYYYRIKLIL